MIDAHMHLWELARGWHPWVTPSLGRVHADALPEQIEAAVAEAGVETVIVVQSAPQQAETAWLCERATETDWIAGVVGTIALGDAAEARELIESRDPMIRGYRQLLHVEDNPGLIADAAAMPALRALAGAALPLDIPDAFPGLFSAVTAAADAVPDLAIVLDHLGKPPVGTERMGEWRDAIAALAERPNVFAKLSGLHGGSGLGSVPDRAELAELVDLAVEAFGPERLMLGSDWPMPAENVDYAGVLGALRESIAGLSRGERAQIESGTAAACYGLEPVEL